MIGAIDRSLLQEMARRAAQAESEGRERVVMEAADDAGPFPGFRDSVRAVIDRVIVSVSLNMAGAAPYTKKPPNGIITNEEEAAEIGNLVYRKPLIDLKRGDR